MRTPFFAKPWHSLNVVANPHVVERVKCSRKKEQTFWERLWRGFWGHNPWPHSLIEYYEEERPAIMFDRRNNCVYCHPAIESEIRKAVQEGLLR